MLKVERYQMVRDVEDVTCYGFSPAKRLSNSDKNGYIAGAEQPDPQHIRWVREWLQAVGRRTKTIRKGPGRSSYSIRIAILQWFIDVRGEDIGYISNGAVIAAALAEGYRAVRAFEDAPNAYFDLGFVRPAKMRKNGAEGL